MLATLANFLTLKLQKFKYCCNVFLNCEVCLHSGGLLHNPYFQPSTVHRTNVSRGLFHNPYFQPSTVRWTVEAR